MSVSIDPFVIPIPQQWLKDPEVAATVQYLWRYLYDLRERTGGGTDYVSDLTDDLVALDVRVDSLETAPAQVYVQDTQPATDTVYIWVQTGLPGGGITLWAEDGI